MIYHGQIIQVTHIKNNFVNISFKTLDNSYFLLVCCQSIFDDISKLDYKNILIGLETDDNDVVISFYTEFIA